MNRSPSAGALLIACAACGSMLPTAASAVIVNLDFRDSGFSTNVGSRNTYNQDGFTLKTVNIGNHLDVPNGQTLAWHHGLENPVFQNTLSTTFSGGAFDFLSIDVRGNPQGLRFTASNGSFQDVAPQFEGVVTFGAAFRNIVSFTIDILGNGTAIHFVDNGMLNTVPTTVGAVPEPETYALMAAGLAALVLAARRRRQKRA
jgi:hypothetical protein